MLKVTIRPKFFGTVPDFDGLSPQKYEIIRDAKLSRIPNHVPNLSRFNAMHDVLQSIKIQLIILTFLPVLVNSAIIIELTKFIPMILQYL